MSIEHLKKQAKNLKKRLPDFVKRHSSGVAPLAEFQELIAQASGYPSWHAAAQSLSERPSSGTPVRRDAVIEIRSEHEYLYITEFTIKGEEKSPREFDCVLFQPEDHSLLNIVTSSLDRFLEEEGSSEDFGDYGPPVEHSQALANLCKGLIRRNSSFLDGYAHLANAQFWLGEHDETIKVCRPVFDQVSSLLPEGFKGRIPYSRLENRPFHRLAHSLVLAYYGLKSAAGDKQALLLAKQMLKWWPNDNLGFRFLLTRPGDE